MLVCEFSKSGQAGHVNKCIDAMNNLIWKYNIIALEKLILCMALRTHEGSEAQVNANKLILDKRFRFIPINKVKKVDIFKNVLTLIFRYAFSSYNYCY